jgi:hypothetical protein
MQPRRPKHAIVLSILVVGGLVLLTGPGTVPASAATTTCTWGGTPVAPTGSLTISPGTTNTPASGPLDFRATGPLAGERPCNGRMMTFEGTIATGSSCFAQVFEGRVRGLPGVVRFWGPGAFGVVDEFLYDTAGNVVGSDQPQVLTNATDERDPLFLDCGTPGGFTEGNFSSTVELYGNG